MLPRINKILNSEQLQAVLETLFRDRPVKILRSIAATGRSQVSWIHIENTISGQRLATFISFQDLIDGFWYWLELLKHMIMSAIDLATISTCIWSLANIGDGVFSPKLSRSGIVIDKDISNSGKERLWINWGRGVEVVNPLDIEIF